MPGVSEEQVRLARGIDLLTYMQANEPHELLPPKNGEYRTVTHGSAYALDYLIKIRGIIFLDAVEMVSGSRASPTLSVLPVEKTKPPPRPVFVPPESAVFPANAVSYLQGRGISPEVISRCLEAGILYESRKYQNVVFVGRDENGTTCFACLLKPGQPTPYRF